MTQRSFRHFCLAAIGAAALAACGGGGGDDDDGPVLQTLSSRPELVSGGDVLVEAALTEPSQPLKATLNGSDVSASFKADPSRPGRLVALLTGLKVGTNELVASNGGDSTTLQLTNYPITGPMISGPHETPFVCKTQDFAMPTGGTLGNALDANCSVATRVQYLYRTSDTNQFVALPTPTTRPANLAMATTNTGKRVPYIVRLETGTINRSIYQTAILHDPVNDPAPGPLARPAGWNGKLIYPLGGGCQGGWYTQGPSLVTPLNDSYLSNGYGVATATLNTFGNNCNDLLSSETILMVKERFVESYGVPTFTIGTGSSGGAYQSNHTADNYPGTFDGIVTTNSFPDALTGMIGLGDARLLDIYFNTKRAGQFSADQQRAVSGFRQLNEIAFLSDRTGTSGTSARRMDPTAVYQDGTLNAGVGRNFRYDPATNPTGARATVYDHTVNVYGKIAGTPGFAQRPLDNVGVQYGLKAFNDGVITFQQFLDLNQNIGGFDIDFKPTAARTVFYPEATRRAYESGRVLYTGNGMASIPIITRHGLGDAVTGGDIHLKYWAFSIRERLIKANGHADNQVIVGSRAPVELLIEQMDRWLTAVKADTSNRTAIQKVVANKPADAVDACWTAAGQKIVEPMTAFGSGQCNTIDPTSSAPNLVAGSPLAADIVKCQLKPVAASDYKQTLTAAQLQQIAAAFPGGVCDWSKPGVEQRPAKPWVSFGPSPVNLMFDVTK
ncbi:DUF6351 family protein [Piscinibacter koreensis]|uniref:DUF6351 domain-containing protein n=1 Tax=Piscinibacter koreensis TaxID=2742824 RepID=A0A7Y6NNM8_9BURK|nr:DUF6351 family protein [Schlegelella koreensis]NUZ06511.1 hypothetical protein [Schlegelella koreensis]